MANPLPRYLAAQIGADLKRKMVFVSGPRQVGKTTLARRLLADAAGYLNWDIPEHRDAILRGRLPATELLVFDELHKYRQWRAFLKGLYDRQDGRQVLVTGSGRLDYYRHGGDSLQGRYHHLRMHPLSVAELGIDDPPGLRRLLDRGGFPEPYLSESPDAAQRWSREYRARLIDMRGRELDLRYFRDVDGREVDFVITERGAPTHLLEVKWSDRPPDRALRYLSERFPEADAYQLSATGTDDYRTPDGIRVQPALQFLRGLV